MPAGAAEAEVIVPPLVNASASVLVSETADLARIVEPIAPVLAKVGVDRIHRPRPCPRW